MRIRSGVFMALLAAVASAAISDAKQEAPVRPHRMWQLGWIGLTQQGHEWDAKVTVIDTDGVCLYVTTSAQHIVETNGQDDAVAFGVSTSIAAVPKTQLPKGAGCQ